MSDADRRLLTAFRFTTTSPWEEWGPDRRSLKARHADRRERGKLEQVLRQAEKALRGAGSLAEWIAVTKRYRREVERYTRLVDRDRQHRLRKSPHTKAAVWANRAGRTELPSLGLGSLILSAHTSLDEMSLKMALLSTRVGVFDDCRSAIRRDGPSNAPPGIRAVQRTLHVKVQEATEIWAAAVMSPTGLGYIGDVSSQSFRAYLRSVLRSIRANRPSRAADFYDETDEPAPHRGRPSKHTQLEDPRLPPDGGPHPWAEGKPALLSRLALEYRVDRHVAGGWVRDGRLEARDCRPRYERTALGQTVQGIVEVPVSARQTWERLSARWHDLRLRKAATEDSSMAEKKRRYRAATSPGGSRDLAFQYVAELARRAGLPR